MEKYSGNNKNGSSNKKAPTKKQTKMLPPGIQQHIGRVLCKDSEGKQYFGTVISYNSDTELFTIKYDEEEFEDVDESEILKMLTTNNHHVEDLLRAAVSDSSPAEPKRVRERAKMDSGPAGPKRISKRAKMKSQKNTSTANYVPRASGSWKDDYYWY